MPASRRLRLASRGELKLEIMYVYILKSLKYSKTYVGIANNLDRRLKEHNLGLSKFTDSYKPWRIIYTEKCSNRQTARKREKYLKASSGRRWIKREFFS